ncbi:glycoside hydrolase family 28 protein [Arachidicoccus ginsenosidivorans]
MPDSTQVGAAHLPDSIAIIKAPFNMPDFKRPVFPSRTIDIRKSGAKQGVLATAIIQHCIDQLSTQGGGTVLIPDGDWFTGRISLKSNINLHLSGDARLHFSGDVKDYQPAVFTRSEGIEVISLGACIYAEGQDNIAITGKGTIYGPKQGGTVRSQVMDSIVIEDFVSYKTPVKNRVYDGKNGGYIFLPMLISPINCTRVFIEGVSLENTAFWNIVPIYCDHVIIRGVTVNSVGIPRGDGMDISSSKNVLIEYCTLSCGDDCFTLKAGRGEDGLRVNIPTDHVVIRNCLAIKGHGGVTCGSETAAMIKNVYVHNCVFEKTNVGIRFKTRRPRGGGGDSLYYENIRMYQTGKAFQWDMLGSTVYVGDLAARLPAREIGPLTPAFKNITFKNIQVDSADWFIKLTAIPESPLTNVTMDNMQIHTHNFFKASDVDKFIIKNAAISTKDSLISLLDTRHLLFENVQFKVPGDSLTVDIKGPKSADILFKNCEPDHPKGWKTSAYPVQASK